MLASCKITRGELHRRSLAVVFDFFTKLLTAEVAGTNGTCFPRWGRVGKRD